MEPAAALGFLVLGIVVGVLLVRWAFHRNQQLFGSRPCAICGTESYVTRCKPCGKMVAMCHYYGILYPDDPKPRLVGKRRSVHVCTACISQALRDSLEAL